MTIKSNFFKVFPAFAHVNYRYYFIGQIVSLIGTWLQIVALGWLVLKLTNSAFWVGTISAIDTLPSLLFGIFGGVIADRFDKKRLLFVTQILFMFFALVLGILTVLDKISLWQIAVLAFLSGTVTSIDYPVRQSFTIEMVGRKDLSSAVALNAATFSGSRVIGPGIAGFLIHLIGIGGTFLLNGFSFVAVITALLLIRVKKFALSGHPHPLTSLAEGFKYARDNNLIRQLLILSTVGSIFGWSYTTLLPLVVQNIYNKDASVLGFLYSAAGFGALFAAAFVSGYSGKINPVRIIIFGNLVFVVSILVFTFIKSFLMALPLLVLAGFGLITQFATINSTIQHSTSDRMRGRILGIYGLTLIGMFPVGSFEIGVLATYIGTLNAIRMNLLIVLLYSVYFIFKLKPWEFLNKDFNKSF